MPITTGSYPKGLSGGSTKQPKPSSSGGGYDTAKAKDQPAEPVFAAQEKGYSQRKAMAAGMIKAT